MTTKINILILGAFLTTIVGLSACSSTSENKQPAEEPLNISVILDLSDRLITNKVQPQMERDTAIIGYLCDVFKSKTLGKQILTSKNKMRVLFYPTPIIPEINSLARKLSVDISQYKGVDKRDMIETMHSTFINSLLPIYEKTINDSKWLGCDIWDFFSSGKVKTQCMEKGSRNIIVILTDGFLYHANNVIKEGDALSYVLPKILNPNSSLIVRCNDLQDLEVLMLEVNTQNPTQRNQLVKVLKDWFQNMGISHVEIHETDLPTSTEKAITNFINN